MPTPPSNEQAVEQGAGQAPALTDLYSEDYLTWRRDQAGQGVYPLPDHPYYQNQQNNWQTTAERYSEVWQALASLPKELTLIDADAPSIAEAQLGAEHTDAIERLIKALSPWKKGPFRLGQRFIDSEWQSQLKWQRLRPHLPALKDASIADIGCNNGYFMLRMLADQPRRIVGFEPYLKHGVHHAVWQHLVQGYRERVAFEPMGVQHVQLWPDAFDVIFCLGILYHHTDPIAMLRGMAEALRKKGTVIIDCQGIAGDGDICLIPKQRYAGAAGIWFLPTLTALKTWVRRAGFSTCKVIFDEPLLPYEQRRSKDAQVDSLAEFLNEDQSATIEGYSPPRRFYLAIRR